MKCYRVLDTRNFWHTVDNSKNWYESSVANSLPVQQLPDNNDNVLSKFKCKVQNKMIIANLNINWVPRKFEQLTHMMQNKVDILASTETKIDSSFSNQQFYIDRFYLPFLLDRNINGGVR